MISETDSAGTPRACEDRRGHMRLAALLLTVALSATLAGCSAVRMAYDGAPWLVLRAMDRWMDLDDLQEEQAQVELEAFLVRHRQQELPSVVHTLRRIKEMAADGFDSNEIDWSAETVIALYRRTIAALIPAISPTLRRLRPEQIDTLRNALDERSEKHRRKYLSPDPAEREAHRVEFAVDRIEQWVGDLNDAQVERIRSRWAELPDSGKLWLAYRQSKQNDILPALSAGISAELLNAKLTAWWVHFDGRSPELTRRSGLARKGWRDILSDLDANLEPGQRARFLEQLEDHATALSRPN